jgi:folate-binding protein YgfZ
MTTPLAEKARQRGAKFADLLGCELPTEFDGVDKEWRAGREGCVVFDAGLRALTAATGEDRITFLQGMLSNDVKLLETGSGLAALVLTQQAKIVTQVRVYAEAHRILIDSFAWHADLLRESLDRYLVADDVELSAPADERPLLGLEGPFAAGVLTEVIGDAHLPREPLAHVRSAYQAKPIRIVRASEVNGNGFLVCGDPSVAASLFDACCEAGALPIGLRALDVLRVERGVPWPGVDTDDSVLAMELPLEHAISYSKGCYLGQEVVERVSARGHVNRKLTGLLVEGDRLPAARAPVRGDGADAGYVTSAVRSPQFGVIALAIVHRRSLEPGTRLEVEIDGNPAGARVNALPFLGQET